MIKYDLQMFGGNGAGGESLGNGGGGSVNVQSEQDVWSARHNPKNADFVDDINSGVAAIENDFPGLMRNVETVNAATLGGADKQNTLGFYSSANKSISINDNYTNVEKMNRVYDQAVKDGYHPSRGNKSGVEAVSIHETGHALTDYVAPRMGERTLEGASKKIVNDAYKASKGRGGTKAWAGKISRYAQESYAECVAEAVADHYCNGSKASSQSKAIMNELFKYR